MRPQPTAHSVCPCGSKMASWRRSRCFGSRRCFFRVMVPVLLLYGFIIVYLLHTDVFGTYPMIIIDRSVKSSHRMPVLVRQPLRANRALLRKRRRGRRARLQCIELIILSISLCLYMAIVSRITMTMCNTKDECSLQDVPSRLSPNLLLILIFSNAVGEEAKEKRDAIRATWAKDLQDSSSIYCR